MTWTDLLRSACFGLLQHKLRTLLTLTGVTLGSLLLFTTLAAGLGVIDAVNERLAVGNRLLEISVASGVKSNEVTVEMARAAGFTGEITDERRIRLAKASGIGGRRVVPLTMTTAEQLYDIKNVGAVWPETRFSLTLAIDDPLRLSRVAVESVPETDLTSLIVAGRNINYDNADEVVISELFLYHSGIQTDEQLSNVIGSTVNLFKPNPRLENASKVLLQMRRMKQSQDPAIQQKYAEQLAIASQTIGDGEGEDEDSSPGEGERDAEDDLQRKLQSRFADFAQTANSENGVGPFRVVGVFRRPTVADLRSNPGLRIARRSQVLMTYPPAIKLWKQSQSANQTIRVTVLANEPETVKQVQKAIDDLGFQTTSMAKLAHQIRSAVLLITAVITAIAAGALFISAIGITNTMVMNVLERRREIAIMKSIGASDRDVNRMFLMEGTIIGAVGGILGLLTGLLLCRLCGDFIRQILENRLNEPFGDSIFAYPFWLIVGTPILAAMVTTIASLLPARRAAKVDPVATLRSL